MHKNPIIAAVCIRRPCRPTVIHYYCDYKKPGKDLFLIVINFHLSEKDLIFLLSPSLEFNLMHCAHDPFKVRIIATCWVDIMFHMIAITNDLEEEDALQVLANMIEAPGRACSLLYDQRNS